MGLFSPQDEQPHVRVRISSGRQARCVVCRHNKVKTASGWDIISYFKCGTCQVPLCKGKDCFQIYHSMLFAGTLPSELLPVNIQKKIKTWENQFCCSCVLTVMQICVCFHRPIIFWVMENENLMSFKRLCCIFDLNHRCTIISPNTPFFTRKEKSGHCLYRFHLQVLSLVCRL